MWGDLLNSKKARFRNVKFTTIPVSSQLFNILNPQKKLKSLNNRISKIETTISSLEQEIKDIDLQLEVNYDATISKPNFFDLYQGKKSKLKDLIEQWEKLLETIEKNT